MSSHPPKVLVLDAHHRHSLAVARSLGRRGVPVIVASPQSRFPAHYSRYTQGTEILDYDDPRAAVDRCLDIVARHGIDIIIPAALAGHAFLCRHQDQLAGHVKAPFNAPEIFDALSNKKATMEMADRLQVPFPRSIPITGPDSIATIAATLQFPLVFKSVVDQGTVCYAHDEAELASIAAKFERENPDLIAQGLHPIAQEYIEGEGCGFFALADAGDVRAWFMHRRMHEVPPSGGPSAMASSFRDEHLADLGRRFFEATGYNGVAMVEFKQATRDGEYYIIEVNPKFWGSLDLAIHSGVDFPWLLYCQLAGIDTDYTAGDYRDNQIFRWISMDLAHSVQARRLGQFARDFFNPRIADDTNWRDPVPFGVLFAQGVGRFLGR